MSQSEQHRTVKQFRERQAAGDVPTAPQVVDSTWLRRICLEAGADDVGFVEVDRPDVADQKADIDLLLPGAKTLISIVGRMNRDNVRPPTRSVANLEFHHSTHDVNHIARKIVTVLTQKQIRAVNGGAVGFPMEADRWIGKMWVISHKPVAVAAGLGHMGIHRNVIHPKFGNFVTLGTIVMDVGVSEYSHPLDYNPCLECKLCVAACPTGAIGSDGHFNFSACYTHNYREFMGGFIDWVEAIVESGSAREYRKKVSSAESVSMWQSLSFGANYKAAYCMAVCPAGEDVIAPYLMDRKKFLDQIVKPLQQKPEIVYAVPKSDAEEYVARRFSHKTAKRVSNGLIDQRSIQGFLRGLPNVFECGKSEGMNVVYHFTFQGPEEIKATVIIRDKKLQVLEGHSEKPDLRVTADSKTWLSFLRKESNIVWALIRRKIRLQGSPRLLLAFGRCFPS
jgi:ferredoxin